MSGDYLERLRRARENSAEIREKEAEEARAREKAINRKKNFREARKVYRQKEGGRKDILGTSREARYFLGEVDLEESDSFGKDSARIIFGNNYRSRLGKKFRSEDIPQYKAEIQATANALMKSAETLDPLIGAQLYEKLGKGRQAVPRLVSSAEKNSRYLGEREFRFIEDFVKKYSDSGQEDQSGSSGIEGRVGVFGLLMLGGIAIGVTSLTSTGNAISNLTTTSQGFASASFFVAGLAGMFFLLKRK